MMGIDWRKKDSLLHPFYIELRILHTLFLWSIVVMSVIFSNIFCPLIARLNLADRAFLYRCSANITSRIILMFSCCGISMQDRENIPAGEPVIFAPNHQGFFDIFLMLKLLPVHACFVIDSYIYKLRQFAAYLQNSDYVEMKGKTRQEIFETMIHVLYLIRRGESFVIFPEGTRTSDGQLQEFKRGAAILAMATGAKIIPTAITGSFRVIARSAFLVRPCELKVRFGKPIEIDKNEDITHEVTQRITDQIKSEIQKMLVELEKNE